MIKSKVVFLKFGLVGILNTLIDFIMFVMFIHFGANYIVAQVGSYTCGLVNSYVLNKSWTFQSNKKINVQEIGKFIAVNFITFLITIGLLHLFKQMTGLDLLLIKLIVTAIGMAVNFIGSKLWVFVERKRIDTRDEIEKT